MIRFAGTDCNFYSVISRFESVDGRRIPVSTVTWDVGRFGRLGYVAESIGCALGRVRSRSLRCLAAHPVDASRGYLPRIVRTVDSWLQSGRTPILPSELLAIADRGFCIVKWIMERLLRRRAERLVRFILPELPAVGPVLDVGSGTGHNADCLAGIVRRLRSLKQTSSISTWLAAGQSCSMERCCRFLTHSSLRRFCFSCCSTPPSPNRCSRRRAG